MSDLEAALGKQSPWQHYHKSASSSVKGPTWSMRISNLGKQSFLQLKKKKKKKKDEISLNNVYTSTFLFQLFYLFFMKGGLYTLNYLNGEILSHVKFLLSCFLYGQNKLLRYEQMMVFIFLVHSLNFSTESLFSFSFNHCQIFLSF